MVCFCFDDSVFYCIVCRISINVFKQLITHLVCALTGASVLAYQACLLLSAASRCVFQMCMFAVQLNINVGLM